TARIQANRLDPDEEFRNSSGTSACRASASSVVCGRELPVRSSCRVRCPRLLEGALTCHTSQTRSSTRQRTTWPRERNPRKGDTDHDKVATVDRLTHRRVAQPGFRGMDWGKGRARNDGSGAGGREDHHRERE